MKSFSTTIYSLSLAIIPDISRVPTIHKLYYLEFVIQPKSYIPHSPKGVAACKGFVEMYTPLNRPYNLCRAVPRSCPLSFYKKRDQKIFVNFTRSYSLGCLIYSLLITLNHVTDFISLLDFYEVRYRFLCTSYNTHYLYD